MRRRDFSLTVALCASLAVHVGVVLGLVGAYIHDVDGHRRSTPLGRFARADEMIFRDEDFGEHQNAGEALNSLDGLEKYSGRQGPQDQAPLSRDPEGNGELVEEAKSFTSLREQQVAMPVSLSGAPAGAEAPFGVGELAMVGPAVKVKKSEVRSQKTEERTAQAAVSPQEQGEGNTQRASGDPAPMSESESDAFSRMGTISVKNGKVDARLGRGFKSVKPRLNIKGELDAISVQRPIVEMKVYVDETGKVIDVKILRSSGSNEIDLPTTTAMYKWWIEPARDKEGKAIKDVILVTFSYL